MGADSLNVIALVSGGKDSFFSLLHCIHHGHRVVALANLFPAGPATSPAADPADQVVFIDPKADPSGSSAETASAQDLNSFMYQTVGHQVIPLYAAATGLPLYRQPILGAAESHARDYDHTQGSGSGSSRPRDETESMLSLLRAIMARHPEANAVCAGAILSTYQRTRVESIALRLGIVPLAYLWKYPVLPPPSVPVDEAQLLKDMAAAGLQARIVKVASAGLDDHHLWELVTSDAGADKVKRALRKFGASEGAALGEGGEFETLVLDGPAHLFQRRICIPQDGQTVVNEGGGSTWLMLRGAYLEEKQHHDAPESAPRPIRVPEMLDAKFQGLWDEVQTNGGNVQTDAVAELPAIPSNRLTCSRNPSSELLHWAVLSGPDEHDGSIQSETMVVVGKIRQLLASASLDASQITTTIIVLRDMADFPKVNGEYGKLFTKPNPPSRVTISCGDQLPQGCNIVIYLTAPAVPEMVDRDGLHVQSRSYWAPANIGPYSQAIDVPITVERQPTGLRSVFIAGQIPLIPASMSLPEPSDTSVQLQIVLSLQHLWRVATEMKIQYWTSAVAYFARSSLADEMQRNAKHAGTAWKTIHAAAQEQDEDEDSGPDPWDLKYNSTYMSLGPSGQPNTAPSLPDWSVLALEPQEQKAHCVPPFFAAEVESLPRDSAVEWHGHIGLSHIQESSVQVVHVPELGEMGWKACHVIARAPNATLIHTVVSCELSGDALLDWVQVRHAMTIAYKASFRAFNVETLDLSGLDTPYLAYVDTHNVQPPWTGNLQSHEGLPFALIPCRSIWSSEGARVAILALYKTTLSSSDLT